LKFLNSKFYKSGDLTDLPENANRDNPYVFDALKKWKLTKRKKVVYSVDK